jgi:hypothetical protein
VIELRVRSASNVEATIEIGLSVDMVAITFRRTTPETNFRVRCVGREYQHDGRRGVTDLEFAAASRMAYACIRDHTLAEAGTNAFPTEKRFTQLQLL